MISLFSPLDTPGFQVGLPANFTPDQMAMLTENAMDSMMSEMATRLKGVTGLQGPHLPWYGRYGIHIVIVALRIFHKSTR